MAPRVVLAMSGGVDSSAAAVLLQRQGYEIIGLFMRSGESESACAIPAAVPAAVSTSGPLPVISANSHRQGCCSAEDAADARRVADRLGIPFHSLNFRDSFQRIKDYFVDEYLAGRTPNPCVQCNNWLKFGKLWDFALQVGADHIATGHYAQIHQSSADQTWQLHRGTDPNKDQSYVLFGIQPDLLSRILFPVGNYQKSEIRELAAEAGLRVATKKDSYEICFVPDNDYAGFIRRHRDVPDTAGNFVDTAGKVLGQHPGYEHFTIGQRKGLGLAFGEPRFVVRINHENCEVVLGHLADLESHQVHVGQVNWLVPPPEEKLHSHVQLRYRQATIPCTAIRTAADKMLLQLHQPASAVAPGQAAVLYQDTQVLGGGWIESDG